MAVSKKSLKNLKKGKATRFKTGEKQVKIAQKGGIASGKAKAEARILKDEILKRMKAKDWDEIVDGVIERAKASDQAFQTLQNTIGQMPQKDINLNVDLPIFVDNVED